MKEIVFATNNRHKLDELRQIVGDRMKILSLGDIDCHDDIPENEPTLRGNALAKARWIKSRYGFDCFADDTGLEVDALGGAPGVYSARYAGPGHDSQANMDLLLKNLEGIPAERRTARFRTVIAYVTDAGENCFEGVVEGVITETPAGSDGFGYDPVFMPQGWDRTFAQATAEEKNAVSHRGRATEAFMKFLLQ